MPLAAPESAELLRGAATAAADRGYQLLTDAADAPGAAVLLGFGAVALSVVLLAVLQSPKVLRAARLEGRR